MLRQFVESVFFRNFITAVIIINSITLGLETSDVAMKVAGKWLLLADFIALMIFVAEAVLKLIVYRFSYFRDGWNWFDFTIIAISVAPFAGNVSVLRALRILRTLRLFSVIPSFRRVVNAFITSIPGMSSIIAVLLLVFYITAVLATKVFGGAFPDYFGDLGSSMFTMFQIMTLESWANGIVRPVLEQFPYAWVFFVPFIVITSFAVLNLFIGVLVSAIEEESMEASQQKAHDERQVLLDEIREMKRELSEIRRELQK